MVEEQSSDLLLIGRDKILRQVDAGDPQLLRIERHRRSVGGGGRRCLGKGVADVEGATAEGSAGGAPAPRRHRRSRRARVGETDDDAGPWAVRQVDAGHLPEGPERGGDVREGDAHGGAAVRHV